MTPSLPLNIEKSIGLTRRCTGKCTCRRGPDTRSLVRHDLLCWGNLHQNFFCPKPSSEAEFSNGFSASQAGQSFRSWKWHLYLILNWKALSDLFILVHSVTVTGQALSVQFQIVIFFFYFTDSQQYRSDKRYIFAAFVLFHRSVNWTLALYFWPLRLFVFVNSLSFIVLYLAGSASLKPLGVTSPCCRGLKRDTEIWTTIGIAAPSTLGPLKTDIFWCW